MKKQITNNQELYIYLASNGDRVAFFSLISPFLKDIFLKFRSQGEPFESATEKTVQTALSSFEKIQNTYPENFFEWFKAGSDLHLSTGESGSEVSFEKEYSSECEAALNETHRRLIRISSKRNLKRFRKVLPIILKEYSIQLTVLLVIIGVAGLLLGFLTITGTNLTVMFTKNGAKTAFSIPFRIEEQVENNNVSKVVTPSVQADSLLTVDSLISRPKVDSQVSPPVEQKKSVPKTTPKPRPRAIATSEFENLLAEPIRSSSVSQNSNQDVQPTSSKAPTTENQIQPQSQDSILTDTTPVSTP